MGASTFRLQGAADVGVQGSRWGSRWKVRLQVVAACVLPRHGASSRHPPKSLHSAHPIKHCWWPPGCPAVIRQAARADPVSLHT